MNNTLKAILITLSLLTIFGIALWGLGDALTPLIISFGLSYLLFPVVKKLEAKDIDRKYSVPALFASVFLVGILILALVLPGIISDGRSFLQELPRTSETAIIKIEQLSAKLGYPMTLSKDSVIAFAKDHVSSLSTGVLKNVGQGIQSSFSGITQWLLAILNLFLIPLFFFYVINDYEKITEELKSFIPKAMQPKIAHYMEKSNVVLSGYVRGQLMVALSLSVLYAFGLSIVGLKFGLIIGLASGLISIIPYAGFSLGFLTAIVVALANNAGMGVIAGVVTVFIIVQALEGTVLTPKLVGNTVGLSAFTTMLVLIIGGNLMGLMGMLIAIPLAAIVKSVVSELKAEVL